MRSDASLELELGLKMGEPERMREERDARLEARAPKWVALGAKTRVAKMVAYKALAEYPDQGIR